MPKQKIPKLPKISINKEDRIKVSTRKPRAKKIPKEREKPPITSHTIHTSIADRHWDPNCLRFVSVDPGIVNFAIRIEKRTVLPDGSIQVIPEVFEKIDLSPSVVSVEGGKTTDLYIKVIRFLDPFLPLLRQSNVIIVEEQLRQNKKMIRMSQHILSYFMIHLRDESTKPLIFEISSQVKSKELNAPKGMDVKIWSVGEALRILNIRKDQVSMGAIETARNTKGKKKKDDLADVIIQIEAVCKRFGWPMTEGRDKS